MRINPFLAFIWLILVLFLSLLIRDLSDLLILLAVSVAPVALLPRGVWISYMKYSLISALFVFLFNLLFLGPEKLDFALAMVFRFLAITSAFAVFSTVADFEDIIDIAERLRLPSKAVASFAISMRFFPQVLRDARGIKESMEARGIRREGKGLKNRVRARIPALSSLLLISLERSIIAAEALEIKSFPSARRRAWRRRKMSAFEIVLSIVLCSDFILGATASHIPGPMGIVAAALPATVLLGVRR